MTPLYLGEHKLPSLSNGIERQLFRVFGGVFGIMVISLIVIFFYPFNPADFHSVDIMQTEVYAGGSLRFDIHFDKYTDLVPEVTRYLFPCKGNPSGAMTLEQTLGEAAPGMKVKPVATELPKRTMPGWWKVGLVIKYPYWGGLRPLYRRINSGCFYVYGPKAEVVK
jgi:hypothetical protein